MEAVVPVKGRSVKWHMHAPNPHVRLTLREHLGDGAPREASMILC